MLSGAACATLYQNASAVWPESVRPLASVMVPEIITGSRGPPRATRLSSAKIAAFALSVSKTVSISSRSAPPSTSAAAASSYASARAANDVFRAPGSFTSGEMLAVRLVGPSTPATYRGREGSAASNSSATARARRAPSRFNSATSDSAP
jgi:hypothetical protein